MRKYLALALCALLLAGSLPAARAEDGFTYELLGDGTYSITGCTRTGDVVIPASYNGKPVTNLASQLFYAKRGITSVSIPASVTYFGEDPTDNQWDYVFSYCWDLKAISVAGGNTVFCSYDGVLYSADMTTLINYPCAKAGTQYTTSAVTNKLCCTSFAGNRNLKDLYLSNRSTIWYTYSFYASPSLTVHYLAGSASESRAQMFIERGLCRESDENFCSFALYTMNEKPEDEQNPVSIDETNFPDAQFRAFVATLDANNSGKLSDNERLNVKTMLLDGKGIADLTGIKHFYNLEVLHCENNSLTGLDMSMNPFLKELYCGGNRLTALDVLSNSELTVLNCAENRLTELWLIYNEKLTELNVSDNALTTLDVGQNPKLRLLNCSRNRLVCLDVSANPALEVLNCTGNSRELTSANGSYNLYLLPDFDVAKASEWTGGTVDGALLWVTEPGNQVNVTYTYDCGGGRAAVFLLNVKVTESPRLPGDATDDGVVDGRDVLRLMKYFAGQEVTFNARNADVTGDGEVDGRDVLRLMKYFAGQNVELK